MLRTGRTIVGKNKHHVYTYVYKIYVYKIILKGNDQNKFIDQTFHQQTYFCCADWIFLVMK